MYELFKKNINLWVIVLIVISFNLIAHSLWSNYFCSTGTATIPATVNTIKETTWSVIMTGEQTNTWIKLSTKPIIKQKTTSWESKVTVKEWTKPILGVQAWYEWESEYERVRNQLIKLWLTYDQAETIVWEGYANTSWGKQFVKSIVWVSNSEWGIFKHGLYNNYLWVMYNWSLRHYDTFALGIEHRRQLYNRNKRYLNTEAQDWLDRHYCVGACSYWVSNYNAWIALLGI